MNTKTYKRLLIGLTLIIGQLTCGMVLTSCSSDEDPFFSATENDAPRILNSDIPEGSNGEPATLMSIERSNNFKFEVIVTPMDYTTVTWLLDGEQIFEGKTIDMPIIAGDHILKIVATTTKGLTTSRTCKLIVRPSAGDPYPGNDIHERLVAPGKKATLHGDNMSKVAKVIIGGQEAPATYHADGDYVDYTVPTLADGVYALRLADAEGMVYGAGTIEINANPVYPEPLENVLWEGHHYVSWEKADGDPNKTFSGLQQDFAQLTPGSILAVTYSIEEADGYHQMQLMSAWWTLLPGHEKLEFSEGGTYEYTVTDEAINLCNEQDGFLIGGHGFYVDKITVKKP